MENKFATDDIQSGKAFNSKVSHSRDYNVDQKYAMLTRCWSCHWHNC